MDKKNSSDVQRATSASLSVQQYDVGDDVVAGFVSRVKSIISQARVSVGRAVNFAMVDAYWQIGKEVIERQGGAERAKYGDGLIKASAARLRGEMGKNIDERELRKMRQFYLLFPIRDALRPELGWAHYREILSVQDEKARNWYVNEAVEAGWSSRELHRQVSVLYYERMLMSSDRESTRRDAEEHRDLSQFPAESILRDPYVLEFTGLGDYPALHEKDIEQALIDNIEMFLLELGKGFCLAGRQKLIRMDDRDFYVDLVFYNSILKCHVLVDLKLGELTYQDIGQMDGYVRMFEEQYRRADDNPTIGLLLCSKKNEAVVKYSVLNESRQLFASRYVLELPTEDELRRMIEQGRMSIAKDESAADSPRAEDDEELE